MLLFKRVNSRHFFLTHISSLFCSFSLGTVKKKKKKKKIKSESETRPLDSSEFHDDAFVFSIIVVLVGVILGVRGILRASLRGENQPLVYDFPVGDLGGFTSVDAVGETRVLLYRWAQASNRRGVDVLDAQHGMWVAHGGDADVMRFSVNLKGVYVAILVGIESYCSRGELWLAHINTYTIDLFYVQRQRSAGGFNTNFPFVS